MIEIDNTPWFVATDVSNALGINRAAQAMALAKFNDAELRNHRIGGGNRGRPSKLITEAGVYVLTFQSRKPEAQAFKAWVTGTVLPAIRKDGAYVEGEEKLATGEMNEDEFLLKAFTILNCKVARITAERDARCSVRGDHSRLQWYVPEGGDDRRPPVVLRI